VLVKLLCYIYDTVVLRIYVTRAFRIHCHCLNPVLLDNIPVLYAMRCDARLCVESMLHIVNDTILLRRVLLGQRGILSEAGTGAVRGPVLVQLCGDRCGSWPGTNS